jgi:putative PIN family toxin of toxin-antitoxin system
MTIRSTGKEPRSCAVLDTNVVLDWLVFRDPRIAALAAAIEAGGLRWIISPPMRAELGHMLVHASLARWSPDAGSALATLDRLSIVCLPASASQLRCTDRDDQIFIDLALAERADWLITHDRALLKLARRARPQGVDVLTPTVWNERHGTKCYSRNVTSLP